MIGKLKSNPTKTQNLIYIMSSVVHVHGLEGFKKSEGNACLLFTPPPFSTETLSLAPDRIADISGHQNSSLLENLLEWYYFIIFRSFPGVMETIPFSIIHTPTLFQLDMKIIN